MVDSEAVYEWINERNLKALVFPQRAMTTFYKELEKISQ